MKRAKLVKPVSCSDFAPHEWERVAELLEYYAQQCADTPDEPRDEYRPLVREWLAYYLRQQALAARERSKK
jgi:hypothetical protein